MVSKLIAIFGALALAGTVAAAPVSAAPAHPPASHTISPAADSTSVAGPDSVPPPGPSSYYTVDQLKAMITGKRIGPSADTGYGEFTITGFVLSGKYWKRTRSAVSYVSPLIAPRDATHASRAGSTPTVVTPDSWYNPSSWNWGHILGSTWSTLWDNCLKGSVSGVIGTAGNTLVINLVARGGSVFLGPYGYAGVAIGGCIAQAVNR